jgi:glucan 1,3-beta-glucosidase
MPSKVRFYCADHFTSQRAGPIAFRTPLALLLISLSIIGPRDRRTLSFPTMVLGFTLTVTTLIAVETALGLVFDPRWQDFPFAGLTMAVVPFWTPTLFIRPKSGTRPVAEAVFAGLFALAARYITINEGFHNWQALWTSVAYLLLAITLWQARCVSAEPPEVDFGDVQ